MIVPVAIGLRRRVEMRARGEIVHPMFASCSAFAFASPPPAPCARRSHWEGDREGGAGKSRAPGPGYRSARRNRGSRELGRSKRTATQVTTPAPQIRHCTARARSRRRAGQTKGAQHWRRHPMGKQRREIDQRGTARSSIASLMPTVRSHAHESGPSRFAAHSPRPPPPHPSRRTRTTSISGMPSSAMKDSGVRAMRTQHGGMGRPDFSSVGAAAGDLSLVAGLTVVAPPAAGDAFIGPSSNPTPSAGAVDGSTTSVTSPGLAAAAVLSLLPSGPSTTTPGAGVITTTWPGPGCDAILAHPAALQHPAVTARGGEPSSRALAHTWARRRCTLRAGERRERCALECDGDQRHCGVADRPRVFASAV